jgi:hypothetical protein
MDSRSNCVVLDTKPLTPTQIERIIRWCDQHFGIDNWDFIADFPSYHWRFYLPDPESGTLFRLRWVH